jgi:hypothetical protein
MPTLNRFPLLGLWAEEAARRLGYTKPEAEALGHAYAVLYAIRARRVAQPAEKKGEKPAAPAKKRGARAEHLRFGGDDLDVAYDAAGRVRGLVGGEKPQTSATYRASVEKKFPPGYYDKLQKCFRRLLKTYPPRTLESRVVYDLYDGWKRSCGKGRLVDLDELVDWCQAQVRAR